MIDWTGYEVFDPGVDRPLHELPRREARAAYQRLMDVRHERIAELARLAATDGVDLDAPDAVGQLDRWFLSSVEPNEAEPGRLRNIWYSVVNDIGLFLGERAIEGSGGSLHWAFFTAGKTDVAYQRHVVMGFDVANKKYNVDFDLLVARHGHRIVSGEDVEPGYFDKILGNALDKA